MLQLAAVVVALIVGAASPAILRPLLVKWNVVDVPNARSSHSVTAIRGFGIAPAAAVVLGLAILLGSGIAGGARLVAVVLATIAAAAILGWIEDFSGLRVMTRLGCQLIIGAVASAVIFQPFDRYWWVIVISAVALAWYINVANFMDGINGISGSHGAIVGLTYAVVGWYAQLDWLAVAGLVFAVAFATFLPWNLLRKGTFLGDVGSYALGAGVASLALAALSAGVSLVVVLGPVVIYLADTATTLVRRIVAGEDWREAHRSHVYQRLVTAGRSHVRVTVYVGIATMLVAAAGLLTLVSPQLWVVSIALMVAFAVVYLSLPRLLQKSRPSVRMESQS